MANNNIDIMGLLTTKPSRGIDPRANITPQQMRNDAFYSGMERMGRGVRGMLGGDRRTPEEQRKAGLADLLGNFDTMQPAQQKQIIAQLQAVGQTALAGQLAASAQKSTDEQKRLTQMENLANALPPEYASLASAVRNGVQGAAQKAVEVLAREEKAPPKPSTSTVDIEVEGVTKKALINDQTGEVIKTFDVEEDRDIIEEVDPSTGQTHNYSVKKDGTDKTLIGVKSLPKYNMEKQDDGTYTVLNETTGGIVQENVPTTESAKIAKQKYSQTVESLHEIDTQIGFIDESKRLTDEYISFLYPLAKYVPTFDARKQKAMVESLQSNLAMNKLMELKRNSTTGASGLGALNQAELIMLQDSLGKLDPAVGDEAFKRQLDLVKKHYTRFRQTLMGITPQIDWENPEYSKFTRTVTDAYGEERKFYFLSDEFGQPQTDPQTGEIQWYEVPRVTIK